MRAFNKGFNVAIRPYIELRHVIPNKIEGFYIHIPFCKAKCPYCDFFSIPYKDITLDKLYVNAALSEFDKRLTALISQGIVPSNNPTIYIGGGTPTVFSISELSRLIEEVKYRLYKEGASHIREITVECNPESSSLSLFKRLNKIGVTRVSIGAQELIHKGLLALQRPHIPDDAINTIIMAGEANIASIAIDLIYGWPSQTLSDLNNTLCVLEDIMPRIQHVSWYELSYEPHTPFFSMRQKGLIQPLDDDTLIEMAQLIKGFLKSKGIYQYEISNFSRPSHECAHNISYWENRPYLGIGPSAVSYIPPRRWQNARDIAAYMRGEALGEQWAETLSVEASFRETVVIGLRKIRGVSQKQLKDRYGIDMFSYYGNIIIELIDAGLLRYDGNDLVNLTKRGLRVSNEILSRLV